MKAKFIPQAVRMDVYTRCKMAKKKICIVSLKENIQFRNALIAKSYQVNINIYELPFKVFQIQILQRNTVNHVSHAGLMLQK